MTELQINYTCTNESLNAVVKGLNLNATDNVLAIAGSGDQAFAMLEFGCKVKIVDYKIEQIDFVKMRLQALMDEDYKTFFQEYSNTDWMYTGKRKKYFSKEGRLDLIRANLDNLVIAEPDDIIIVAKEECGFSKIYLSNALCYMNPRDCFFVKDMLKDMAEQLPMRGLIYVSNHDQMAFDLSMLSEPCECTKAFNSNIIPSNLLIDAELTRKARFCEDGFWTPAVYRKTEVQE